MEDPGHELDNQDYYSFKGNLFLKTIALAGEAFSRNIGDQAIHACLAYILRQQQASLEILSLDISGREVVVSSGGYQAFSILRAMPGSSSIQPLVNIAFDRLQRRRKQFRTWNPVLEKIDGLVIGGGQLLMDNNLDFPLKLSSLARLTRDKDIPYHITSCGVGKSWSHMASRLFHPVLENAKSVTLRDELSRERLGNLKPMIKSQVTFDPAIMAAEVYPATQDGSEADRVGLGVMSRTDVNSRLLPAQRFSTMAWLDLWMEMLSGLVAENIKVELFTTGSPQDERFAQRLFVDAHERGWNSVSLAGDQDGPAGLLKTMRNYSLVIATRLHASILANSLGISTLGLGWDDKVKSYYAETGLTEHCFHLAGLQVTALVSAARRLNRQPFSATLLEDLKDRARENAQVILDPDN